MAAVYERNGFFEKLWTKPHSWFQNSASSNRLWNLFIHRLYQYFNHIDLHWRYHAFCCNFQKWKWKRSKTRTNIHRSGKWNRLSVRFNVRFKCSHPVSCQKRCQAPLDSSSDLTALLLFKYLWNFLPRNFLILILLNEKKPQLGHTALLYWSYFQYLFLLFLSEITTGFKYKICILVLIIHSDTAVVQNPEQPIFPKITAICL